MPTHLRVLTMTHLKEHTHTHAQVVTFKAEADMSPFVCAAKGKKKC